MLSNFIENTNIIDIQREAGTWMYITFGENEKNVRYELYIQAMSRITKDDVIILSQLDSWSSPEQEDEQGFNVVYDIILRDKILPLLPLRVKKAVFSEIGDIEIMLDNHMVIRTFNDYSDGREQWRLFDNLTNNQYVFEDYQIHISEIDRDF